MRVSPGARVSQAGSLAPSRPAARNVPRVRARGTPHFAEKAASAAGVVAVLVRDEDGVERSGVDPRRLQPLRELARPEPGVEQHARSAALDQGGVARAARAEDAEAEAHPVLGGATSHPPDPPLTSRE